MFSLSSLVAIVSLLMAFVGASKPELATVHKRQAGTPTGGSSGGSANTGAGSGNTSPPTVQQTSIVATQLTTSDSPGTSSIQSQQTSQPGTVASPTSLQPPSPSSTVNPAPSFSAPPTSQRPTSETSVPQVSSQAPTSAGPSSQPAPTSVVAGSNAPSTIQGSSAAITSGGSVVSSAALSTVTGPSGTSVINPALGTTSENGQLVFRTTNAQGSTITYSGSAASSAITAPVTETSALLGTSTRPVTSTIVITSDGRAVTSVATTNVADVQTTGFATSTSKPQLNGSGGSGGSSGLSPTAKKTVGGVVGGIGGAIVIGALALVAWRIWGRKKHNPEEDTLVAGSPYPSGGPTLTTEKRSSHGGSTVYSNGMERYGQQQNVNTASNF